MSGKFTLGKDVVREQIEWGVRAWFSLPESTSTQHLVLVEVDLTPGFGHNFHIHPNQEEIIYVLAGELDQWLETEHHSLKPGDTVFIPKNTVMLPLIHQTNRSNSWRCSDRPSAPKAMSWSM